MSKENQLSVRTYWEFVLPALAIVSLLISCVIISYNKHFWNDELYSYYFTSDPSLGSMLSAFHDKINNTPLLYFLLGWIWDKAFGSTELSLRLFSSLGMCVALLAAWLAVRRHFGLWPTTIGVLGVFCTSEIILSQNAEARMYGLFLAVCALALLVYDKFYRTYKPSTKLLVLNACVHIAIVHTHLFGGFYSGAILLSMLVTDRFFNLFRPRVYFSIILSWLSILLYIPSFLNQADAGNPRTWLPEPVFRDLLDMFNFRMSPFLHQSLLILLLVVSVLLFFRRETKGIPQVEESESATDITSRIPVMVIAVTFLILPIFIWAISKTIKPIFWNRYMIPSALGWVIMLAYFSSKIFTVPVVRRQRQARVSKSGYLPSSIFLLSALSILVFCLSRPILFAKAFKKTDPPGYGDATGGYDDLPIVVQQYSGEFLERIHYAPDPGKYYFILDWEAAVGEYSGLFSPQEYKHMKAIKRQYPHLFENNILESEEFLQRFNRFLVLDYPDYLRKCPSEPKGLEAAREWKDIQCPQWVEMRLLNNAAYKVTVLNNDNWFTVLLVEKQKSL